MTDAPLRTGPRWLPMESNPEVMTKFLSDAGMQTGYSVQDILGFDPELLAMLPTPVRAVILLFECTGSWKARELSGLDPVPDGVFFMKQSIGNACGTIALIHSVGNNQQEVPMKDGSMLDKFFKNTKGKSPQEIGTILEGAEDLTQIHEANAKTGQTATPDIDTRVNFHFIAFVQKNGHLYELDGGNKGPIDHGVSNEDSFLSDASAICLNYIKENPDGKYSAVALCPEPEE